MRSIRICNGTRNPITDFNAEISDLGFPFFLFLGKSEKGFEKLFLRTAVLHAHAYLAKRRPLFTRIVLQILFRISQSNGKKEIHEIRIWILKSIVRTDFSKVKSIFGFRVLWQNSKSRFPNRTHPYLNFKPWRSLF